MNAITEIQNIIKEHAYLKDLCKEQAGKIEQLEKTQKESEDLLWRRRLFEESIQKVGAVLNEAEKPSLYVSTARTKTFEINKEIAEHLRELGKMTSDFHKTGAYETASQIITTLDFEVKNGESLLKIRGIGKGIVAKVDQFLDEYFDDEESVASTEGQIIEESDDSEESEESEESDSSFFVSYNNELVDIFDKLASLEDDSHKRNAYRTVGDAIQSLPFKVKSGEELSKGPKKVKGIGKSAAKIIDEFLETGKVKKLEKEGTSTNEEVARALIEYADDLEDPFKVRVYRNAADVINNLDYEVTSGAELAKGPKKVKGIGKGIAYRIDKFLQTGEMN